MANSRIRPLLSVEDDVPFDTFDRELLAQLGEQGSSLLGGPARPAAVRNGFPMAARGSLAHQFTENSPISPATPVLGQYSSSPESNLQSSPLLRYFRPSQPRTTSTPDFSEGQRRSLTTEDRVGDSAQNLLNRDEQVHLSSASPSLPRQISLSHAPPVVQGIRLIATTELPDRFRALFPYPLLNAVQSKCFPHVYENDYNMVVSAPTGSGKTVIMELAICRLVNNMKYGLFKLVYQAPTRALCSERFRDWSTKFTSLGLQCAELTGDTDYAQSRLVQTASIIITTPEKWDSMTRRWRDHAKLMQLVRLFLIDEVHVLNESRGAALEAVVSRMKSVGSNVRFVALSATIPNSEDIATWLGKNDTLQHLPAHKEHFGEDFRPTKLRKIVYGYPWAGNDFAFDKLCGSKLPEIITKHSNKKPMMIFCCTRNSAISTAKELSKLWSNTVPKGRMWAGPVRVPVVKNTDLKALINSGVAFHHAGLDSDDRHTVEKAFLEGKINIICCTSTLAVGVNLPCYLVIIKNTVCWQDGGCKEYSDLEMMQMLGRAGRPQFDDTAVAVILTKKERVSFYEKMISGTEQLESCLHLNLIDHLSAEISLGTVSDIQSAIKWLAGTFLFVRLRRNPTRYKLKENADHRDEDEMLQHICEKDVKLLQECDLVSTQGSFKSTPFGDAMAKYYVKFETMRILLALPPRAKVSEILSSITQAAEFHDLRLKATERPFYREINRAHGIRFPIKVEMSQTAHKISLLVQSELGAVDFPSAEQFQRHRLQFQQDKMMVFTHVNRLIRCIIDCQVHNEDGISVRNSLELARSFAGRVWENSPLQMKQIDQIGVVAVRKLAAAGITSIQTLEETEAHRIDMILSKNPPFGMKLLARLTEFPKLRVTLKMLGKSSKHGKSVRINFKADIGFINEKTPISFHKRPVYVCFLAEVSDGRLVDFRRMRAQKLQNDHEILLSADITSPLQHITCYVMCDEVGGTCQYAELKPDALEVFLSGFPAESMGKASDKFSMNTSRRRGIDTPGQTRIPSRVETFEDDDIPDDVFLIASQNVGHRQPQHSNLVNSATNGMENYEHSRYQDYQNKDHEQPLMLENGKYKCNHRCKDKSVCKHFCCREGLDKPPKTYSKNALSKARPHEMVRETGQLVFKIDCEKSSYDKGSDENTDCLSDEPTDYLDLTLDNKQQLKRSVSSGSTTRQITTRSHIVDSKVTRMARLDLVSSQATVSDETTLLSKPFKKTEKRKRSYTRRKHPSSEDEDSTTESPLSPMRHTPDITMTAESNQITLSKNLDPEESVDNDVFDSEVLMIEPEQHDLSTISSPITQRCGQQSKPAVNASQLSSFEMKNAVQPVYLEGGTSPVSQQEVNLPKRNFDSLNSPSHSSRNEATKRFKADTERVLAVRDKFEANNHSLLLPNDLKNDLSDQSHSQDEEIDQLLLQEYGDIVNFSDI